MWRRHVNVTPQSILEHVLPAVLRIAFLIYPIVTNVAFEAFSCFEFEDGRGWLITDVAIECRTAEHATTTAFATLAIITFPVGIFVLSAKLLFDARGPIRSESKNRVRELSL